MKLIATIVTLLLPFAAFSKSSARWLETTHNFGAFSENDGKVSCTFRFVNDGDTPVIIQSARATCGCTTPDYSKAPIAPGDTGIVQVSYNPTGRPGRFDKKIYVDLSTEPSRFTLSVIGSVIGTPATIGQRFPAEAGPFRMRNSAIAFGEVYTGHGKTFFLDIYNTSPDPLVPRWEELPPYMTLTAARDTVYPGENLAFTFTMAADKAPMLGLLTDSIMLAPGNGHERIPVPVMVMVKEDFSKLTGGQRLNAPEIAISDPALDFDRISRAAGKATATFTITNRGKDQLILRWVYSADPGIQIKTSSDKIKKGKSATVTVTADPSQIKSDILDARINVIANDPMNPVTVVRAVGMITP